jgi:hypothetical protein
MSFQQQIQQQSSKLIDYITYIIVVIIALFFSIRAILLLRKGE